MKFDDCCFDCGIKRYNTKIAEGITVHFGKCPFCKQDKLLIPAADWAGHGD